MRKLLAILFLTLIFLKIGGFVALLSIGKELIREKVTYKIKYELKSINLKCIVGTNENLSKIVWEEENKEFSLNGELYDIVKIEEKNGVKFYYCLPDEIEQELKSQINHLVLGINKNTPINHSTKGLLVLIFQQATILFLQKINIPLLFSINNNKFPSITSFYDSPYINKTIAPPEAL